MMPDMDRVIEIAKTSRIATYRWKNRGRAPSGYIQGMAVAFAEACEDLARGDNVATAIAAPLLGDDARDALDWYGEILAEVKLALGDPINRLTAVFAILLGLGMRESSGKHCEGRDMSAENVTAETAEAGVRVATEQKVRLS